jgi:hypothetical protein
MPLIEIMKLNAERAAIKACYVYVSTEGARWNYKL